MKKFTKVSLILVAVFFGLGIIFCAVSTAVGGGWAAVHQKMQAGEYDFGNWHFGNGIYYGAENGSLNLELENIDDFGDMISWGVGKTGLPGGNESTTDSFIAVDVTRISADLDLADVRIVEGTDEKNLIVTMEQGFLKFYSAKLNGNTLSICYDQDHYTYKNTPVVTIEIPAGFTMDKIEINTALGDIEYRPQKLTCKELELETAMGDVEVNDGIVEKSTYFYSAMGDVKVKKGEYQDASIGTAMGSVEVKGIFPGDLEVENGMGDIDVEVTGQKEEYYNYELSCGMGEIEFNGKDYGSFSSEFTRHNTDAQGDITMDAGMGDISLTVSE